MSGSRTVGSIDLRSTFASFVRPRNLVSVIEGLAVLDQFQKVVWVLLCLPRASTKHGKALYQARAEGPKEESVSTTPLKQRKQGREEDSAEADAFLSAVRTQTPHCTALILPNPALDPQRDSIPSIETVRPGS